MASRELAAAVELMTSFRERPAESVTIEQRRQAMETMQGSVALAEDVTVQKVDADGVPAEWVTVPASNGLRIVLYFHGGGYCMGSLNTHRELVSRIARAAQARVLNVDYRLAPEQPFPAALDDAVASYRWLLAADVDPHTVVVGGDSAGGGLALAFLARLRDEAYPLPAGAVLLSPWTDLTGSGDSICHRRSLDPMIDAGGLHETAGYYCTEEERANPYVSPLFDSLRGLPPLLVQVGGREVLIDDSIRVAEKAEHAGVDVTLQVWEEAFHVFQALPALPEAAEALSGIGRFVMRVTK